MEAGRYYSFTLSPMEPLNLVYCVAVNPDQITFRPVIQEPDNTTIELSDAVKTIPTFMALNPKRIVVFSYATYMRHLYQWPFECYALSSKFADHGFQMLNLLKGERISEDRIFPLDWLL